MVQKSKFELLKETFTYFNTMITEEEYHSDKPKYEIYLALLKLPFAINKVLTERCWAFLQEKLVIESVEDEDMHGYCYAYKIPTNVVSLGDVVSDDNTIVRYRQFGNIIYSNTNIASCYGIIERDLEEIQAPLEFFGAVSSYLAFLMADSLDSKGTVSQISIAKYQLFLQSLIQRDVRGYKRKQTYEYTSK